MTLPIFQSQSKELSLMQTSWKADLDPILTNPLNNGLMLTSVALVNGNNTVNHKLGRVLQGWMVTRMIGAFAQLYDLQSTNTMTDKTLILHSNGSVTVNLWVF